MRGFLIYPPDISAELVSETDPNTSFLNWFQKCKSSSHRETHFFFVEKMGVPFLLAFFFLRLAPSISSNPEGDALHALRSRLSDPNNVLQSWDPTLVNPCTWFHVSCDSDGHVVRLDLGNSNVSGTLGPELGHLKHLRYLELYRNDIKGNIPKELGNLENLISMDLYENQLEGPIPRSFSKLKSLRFLRLNKNKLSGHIPRELTALSNLKNFDVSKNDLCGTIPVDGPFASFPMESFENNRFSGPELQGLVSYDFGC
ncbi:hypothetical protein MLD38_013762 [Melastoma candidum]|uniref:Uncharacterized protein n=1 Tax=Melastoma candidum TaxID=119954 RepID=A0ACB9RBS2_9MYRT|nr:hypothetical protein MLD38_013762 [Melastoma candidum]